MVRDLRALREKAVVLGSEVSRTSDWGADAGDTEAPDALRIAAAWIVDFPLAIVLIARGIGPRIEAARPDLACLVANRVRLHVAVTAGGRSAKGAIVGEAVVAVIACFVRVLEAVTAARRFREALASPIAAPWFAAGIAARI
jgi:hypothetical protein